MTTGKRPIRLPAGGRQRPPRIPAMKGAKIEIAFWKKFVHTDQFKTWLSPEPTPELDPNVVEMIKFVGGAGFGCWKRSRLHSPRNGSNGRYVGD